jgi:hypothetical protein
MSDNSIYSYYERVTNRFYSALCFPGKEKVEIKFIWEPMARKIIISGFRDFDFFLTGKRGNFEVHEALSGSVIIRQEEMPSRILRRCNSVIFINHLPAEIKKRGGRSTLNQAIINFMVDHDQKISPRYKAKKV